jgi:hypothetical protein
MQAAQPVLVLRPVQPLDWLAVSDHALISLAILTVNWDSGRDVLDSFVPLVAAQLERDAEKPVSALELQQNLVEDAGIKIPLGALQSILKRCADRNYLKREAGVYYPNAEMLHNVDFHQVRADALRQHKCLLEKLRTFAKDRYELQWSEADADENVLNYLQEGSLPILQAAIDGDPLPDFRPGSRRARHVISAFALHLSERDPEGFACLETVVKGHILSGVLFYPNMGEIEAKFTDLAVYFDTPVLLPLLGYGDDGTVAQCRDLVELLSELGAKLCCFHHTREELVGVLEAIANGKRPGAYRSQDPHYYETSKHFSLSDVEEMIVSIDDRLKESGVDVVDRPPFADMPDETALEEVLAARIPYNRKQAREKDAQSLAAVARLRGMRRMDRFENAKAILLTANPVLVSASREFFRDIGGGRSIPMCMSEGLMTRLAWVKRPMLAPEMPRHAVMASSYAALNPKDELWRRYIEEVEHRREAGSISDEQYHVLRSSREAREMLMDRTFGLEEAFTAGTVDEVLAHATAVIREEAEAETKEARQAAHLAERGAEEERSKRERLERAHIDKADRRARAVSALLSWSLACLLAAVVVVGVVATIPGAPFISVDEVLPRVAIWAVAVITLFTVVVRHVPILALRRRLERVIEAALSRWGRRRLESVAQAAERDD